jgi:hypothetical protein
VPCDAEMDDLRVRIQQLSKRLHEFQGEPDGRYVKGDPREQYSKQERDPHEDLRYSRLGHHKDERDYLERRHLRNDSERRDQGLRQHPDMRSGLNEGPKEFGEHNSRDLRDWLDPRYSSDDRKYRPIDDYKTTERDRHNYGDGRYHRDLRSEQQDYSKAPHRWDDETSDLREGLKKVRYPSEDCKNFGRERKDDRSVTSSTERHQADTFKTSSTATDFRRNDHKEPSSRDGYQFDDYEISHQAKVSSKEGRPESFIIKGEVEVVEGRRSTRGGSIHEVDRNESLYRSGKTSSESRPLFDGRVKNSEVKWTQIRNTSFVQFFIVPLSRSQ